MLRRKNVGHEKHVQKNHRVNHDIMFCRFRDMLGKPNTGLHAYRLGPIALVDFALTILVAWLLTRYVGNLIINSIGLLLLGVVAHTLFCVKTPLNNWIEQIIFTKWQPANNLGHARQGAPK